MALELPRVAPGRYALMRPPRALAHRTGHLWEQGLLPLLARTAALIYSPANLAPLASSRNVVVIHDAAALRHPEWYSRAYVAYQRRVLPLLARRARLVITVSDFSRRELVDAIGVPERQVAVVPNGVDERFSNDADPAPARTALGLDSPYVLTVGTRIGRKNLAALEAAAARLAPEGIELVAAGSGRAYMRAEADGGLRSLGYVPDDLLPGLYAGALALAMPSLYEGFGLPCLEAMACGTPVVAADRGALPETCGGAALLADPDQPRAFADALVRAATDERERARLSAAGRERASGFTWRRAAEETDALVEGLLRHGA
jgi:glycosyltransferase involved in cell wall biosynthesis